MHGRWTEGLAWIDAALANGPDASPAERARALIGAAALRRTRGELAAVAALARQAVAIRRELRNQAGLAESLLMLADMLGPSGAANQLAGESLGIRRQRGDTVSTAWALLVMANLAVSEGAFARGQAYLEEGITIRKGQRDNLADATILRNLGRSTAAPMTRARRVPFSRKP